MENNAKVTAIYCRKEKSGDHIDSEKLLLQNYAVENGFHNIEYFVDEGYRGTGVLRPTYLNMLNRVCSGEIGTIIVKKHSTFGGNTLASKQILNEIINEFLVRYIAVADQIDSSKGWEDFFDYGELIKSLCIKDKTAKAVKEKQKKAVSEIRLSKTAYYGHRVDPNDPQKLVIDDESAEVIRKIFNLCAEGYGIGQIVDALNDEQILVPSVYMYERGIIDKTRLCRNPYVWSHAIVANILNNRLYIGEPAYEKDAPRQNAADKHPTIIDRAVWNSVEKICSYNRKPSKYGAPGYFSGIATCSDCGNTLSYHPRMVRNKAMHFYTCATYNKSKGCTAHYISEQSLVDIVLQNLNQLIDMAHNDQNKFEKMILGDAKENVEKALENDVELINHYHKRVEKIYLSMKNVMDSKEYHESEQAVKDLQAEKDQLSPKIEALETKVSEQNAKLSNLSKFISTAQKEKQNELLNRDMIDEFINSIVVYNASNTSRKNKDQKVEVFFNYIAY